MAEPPPGPPLPLPVADAVALTLVARIDFPAPPAGAPWLGAGAAWVGRIAPALRHAGVELAQSEAVFVRVAAVRPAAAGAPASDYDPALVGQVAAAVAALLAPGAALPSVAVHEEWRGDGAPRIEVAVYARAAGA